jgi:uncharacterized lipoprotein YehR (DUF1307 family)
MQCPERELKKGLVCSSGVGVLSLLSASVSPTSSHCLPAITQNLGQHAARHEEKRTIIKIPAKSDDEPKKVVRQRSRTISYKIPDERPKPCHTTKPAEKLCIERKITYKDLDGNVVKIVYEDSCGKIIRTIYPALPPAPPAPKCSPPPPSPPKCSSPPVSEPSNIPSEDVRNCNWTKIVVKNSRGVVWKIVHVDCDGKTMKTEYPEAEPPKRRSIETRRYVVKELDDGPSRRIVIQKESRESVPSRSSGSETTKTTEKDVETRSAVKSASGSGSNVSASAKESDVQSSQKSASESTTTRRDSANSSGGRKSFESAEEIVKDENGVTKRVTYTDSRGRRRTVVYDD